MNPFSRTQFVLGSDAMEKLKNARVAIFGLGGVGGYVAEALARSGVGALDLVDHDTISLTNINRQILATRDTVGMDKAEAAAQRVHPLSVPWAPATSWIPPPSVWRISTKPPCVPWPGSSARNAANGALRS